MEGVEHGVAVRSWDIGPWAAGRDVAVYGSRGAWNGNVFKLEGCCPVEKALQLRVLGGDRGHGDGVDATERIGDDIVGAADVLYSVVN